MINKFQIRRKFYASLIAILSLAIIGPLLITTQSEDALVVLWVLIIMILILSGTLFFYGVIYTAMTLTYFCVLSISIILGVLLNYIVKVPVFIDKSSVVTGVAVVLCITLIQICHLPRKAGDYFVSKLNPELLPKNMISDHSYLKTQKPYYYLFGNRVGNISSGQSYALENDSQLKQKLRIWICILFCISGFIILLASGEITTITEVYGEFFVYFGIYVGFSLVILGFTLLLSGFARMTIGAAISVIMFFILHRIVIVLNEIYLDSLWLFWSLVVMGLCFVAFLFYRIIRRFEITLSRNLTIYEIEGTTIAFDLLASRELPLVGFSHFSKITLKLPKRNIIKKIVKWTDKIRYFSIHRRILLGGYKADHSTNLLYLYIYAETSNKLTRLERYISRFVAKPTKIINESDFENKAFLNELIPDTNTLIETLNKAVFKDLELRHFTFDRPFDIEFYVKFIDIEALKQFMIISEEIGYGKARCELDFIVVIKKDLVLELNQMNKLCQRIHQLANQYDGAYIGWNFEGESR